MLTRIGKFTFLTCTLCLALMLCTSSLTYAAMVTTYELTSGDTGSFSVETPMVAPFSLTAWDFDFGGVLYNSATDTVTRNICDSNLFCALNIQNTAGDQTDPLSINLATGMYNGVTFGPSGFFDFFGTFQEITNPVPAPTSMILFGSGLLGLTGYRWQQRRREGTQVG